MSKNDQPKSNVLKIILRRILHIVTILIVVAMVIVGGFYVKRQFDVNNIQASMKEYLQNKYKQESYTKFCA